MGGSEQRWSDGEWGGRIKKSFFLGGGYGGDGVSLRGK